MRMKHRQAIVLAMAALARVMCKDVSPWTGEAWTFKETNYLTMDFVRWAAGVRDARISDFAAVNAEALYKHVTEDVKITVSPLNDIMKRVREYKEV